MKKLYTLVCFMFVASSAYAQTNYPDFRVPFGCAQCPYGEDNEGFPDFRVPFGGEDAGSGQGIDLGNELRVIDRQISDLNVKINQSNRELGNQVRANLGQIVTLGENARRFQKQTSKGIAASAALASVPHIDGKLTLALGFADYDGQSGYAGKLNYQPSDRYVLSVGGAQDVYSVGVGFKIK